MRRLAQFVAVAVVAAVVSAASVGAASGSSSRETAWGQHRFGTVSIQPADLSRQTVAWLNARAPSPRGRGVTVSNGEHGDRVRVTAASVSSGGDVLGQIEYLGGLSCPELGPWLTAEATFFNASGVVVATGSDSETSPVESAIRCAFSGVREPSARRWSRPSPASERRVRGTKVWAAMRIRLNRQWRRLPLLALRAVDGYLVVDGEPSGPPALAVSADTTALDAFESAAPAARRRHRPPDNHRPSLRRENPA